jgi:hypothetical protein
MARTDVPVPLALVQLGTIRTAKMTAQAQQTSCRIDDCCGQVGQSPTVVANNIDIIYMYIYKYMR